MPANVLIGQIRFDPRRSYSGEDLNRFFAEVRVATTDAGFDQGALARLPGVKFGFKVSDGAKLPDDDGDLPEVA